MIIDHYHMVDYLAYSDTLLTPSTSTSTAPLHTAPNTPRDNAHRDGQARLTGRATPHRLRFHQRPRPVPRPAPRPRTHV